jgi:glycerate kinase
MTVGIIGNRKIGETVIWNLSGLGCKVLPKEYKRRRRSMKAVIAIDSLKGSLSSMEAGYAIADGIRRVHGQDAEIVVRPLADGGEGTVEALVSGMSGVTQNVMVTGPLGIPVNCEYGIIESSHTAVIEMSGAAGITLVPDEKRNPLYTTTYGVGEVIKDAIAKGCRRFIVGIGGSATNDGGVGMLQALGYGFLDKEGKQVPFGARGLEVLEEITDEYVLPELAECEFRVACDVTNILCGENGCSAVYGPQKGATPSMVMQMDNWLKHYAKLAEKKFTKANANQAGTGAAGGLGFAFLSFTNAVLESGIKIVLEETCLEKYMENADIVITGEGRLDGQTAMGKAPVGVARLAKKHDIPVIAFAGSVTKEAVACNQNGIDAFFPILRGVVTLEEAMKPENAKANMTDTVEQVFRLMNMGRK